MERTEILVKKAAVIGGGLGGLACAIRLAAGGWKVTVCEQQPKLGGKLQRIDAEGYRFDRGPSTITMLDSFEAVFASAGRKMEHYLSFYPIHPLTRNLFADGHIVDAVKDRVRMMEQIARYSPEDARNFPAFMEEAGQMYRIGKQQFLNKLLLDWKDKVSLPMAASFFRIRPFTKLQGMLRRYFRHPNTLALFGRYATYVGSSPYSAPAVFSMLASLEADEGIYGVKGGTYEIVKAFTKLAQELGVEILASTAVEEIRMNGGRASGVMTSGGFLQADAVIANGDVLSVYEKLVPQRYRPSMSQNKIERYEPSLSGFVTLLGVKKKYDLLKHHTVFFPQNYSDEFNDIFVKRVAPKDPTLYICCTSGTEPETAPAEGSSLFVLANAPYVTDAWDWQKERDSYREHVKRKLESAGLTGLALQTEVEITYTPLDLERDTSAYKGAIYGISSNSSRQTFARPANRSKDIDGLWFVGGTTHPGGGTPVVTASGRLVAERILQEYSV
ncbi:phytoene desaturase family protein [Paenibacillus gansuensis]|uniref:4,4'-diaponeurosporene oxygenase n=1 Tax=Paenibacillus gansuensis TaxID=306542 RepID=A0ABW5PBG9_9BACL